jgi:hypothetical protein
LIVPPSNQGCIKLVAAGILPAVSGGFQPRGREPGAFSSGETPDLRRQKASLREPWRGWPNLNRALQITNRGFILGSL